MWRESFSGNHSRAQAGARKSLLERSHRSKNGEQHPPGEDHAVAILRDIHPGGIQHRVREEMIYHSDRGSLCEALAFGQRCKGAGVRPSMGSVGDCFDNAMCESFFATIECELIEGESFADRSEARRAVFDFVEGFYNPRRLHSALDFQSTRQLRTGVLLRTTGPFGGSIPCRSMIACDCPLYRGSSKWFEPMAERRRCRL